MISSGLTSSVINRARLGDGYIRVRDSGLVTAVAQFLYDEAALLDEWRLDEWLALFHPKAAKYLIPSPEDLSDDPATTLHLVNDSMTTLAGRIGRLKSKHAHAESPRSRTRRQIANVRVWQGPACAGAWWTAMSACTSTSFCRTMTKTCRGSSAGAAC
jgi:hypothetical protein